MKILFLDVDGVLNHNKMPKEQWADGHFSLDPACVERVRRICDRTGARIVVSSTWRRSSEAMQILLDHFGSRIIGVTAVSHFGSYPRRHDIERWIEQHSAIPLVCVAVDDDDDASCEGVGWSFVQTDDEDDGLNENLAMQIEQAFGSCNDPR